MVVSFGLLFASTTVVAQETVPEESCISGDQEQNQEELPVCEEESEVVDEEIPEALEKGVPSIETVAGTDKELAEVPAVLGESTEVLADTGSNTELAVTIGVLIILTTGLLFRVNNTYKTHN